MMARRSELIDAAALHDCRLGSLVGQKCGTEYKTSIGLQGGSREVEAWEGHC